MNTSSPTPTTVSSLPQISSLALIYQHFDRPLRDATNSILDDDSDDRAKVVAILALHLEANALANCEEVDNICIIIGTEGHTVAYRLAYLREVYK